MARRAKVDTTGTNGFNPEQVEAIVAKIEGIEQEKESEKGAYMQRCQVLNERKNMAFEEAQAYSIPKKELKAVLKLRELDRKRVKLIEEAEGETRDNIELLIDALGGLAELPLGLAAIDRSAPDGAALDELTG